MMSKTKDTPPKPTMNTQRLLTFILALHCLASGATAQTETPSVRALEKGKVYITWSETSLHIKVQQAIELLPTWNNGKFHHGIIVLGPGLHETDETIKLPTRTDLVGALPYRRDTACQIAPSITFAGGYLVEYELQGNQDPNDNFNARIKDLEFKGRNRASGVRMPGGQWASVEQSGFHQMQGWCVNVTKDSTRVILDRLEIRQSEKGIHAFRADSLTIRDISMIDMEVGIELNTCHGTLVRNVKQEKTKTALKTTGKNKLLTVDNLSIENPWGIKKKNEQTEPVNPVVLDFSDTRFLDLRGGVNKANAWIWDVDKPGNMKLSPRYVSPSGESLPLTGYNSSTNALVGFQIRKGW